MEGIKVAKQFIGVGLIVLSAGGIIAGLHDARVFRPKTAQGESNLAITTGFLGGAGSVIFGIGLGGMVGLAEELAENVVKEVV